MQCASVMRIHSPAGLLLFMLGKTYNKQEFEYWSYTWAFHKLSYKGITQDVINDKTNIYNYIINGID